MSLGLTRYSKEVDRLWLDCFTITETTVYLLQCCTHHAKLDLFISLIFDMTKLMFCKGVY